MATPKEDSASYYYFDDVSVDRVNFRVLKGDNVRTLEPRAFDLLTYLIANRGRVVEKQELFEQIWKQAFVTDNALTRAVKEVRRVIGDDAASPRYIETIPKRGYRFLAEVKTSKEPKDETEQIIPRRPEEVVTALNYKVRGKLGQGGGGVVFLAEDTRLGRTVVLKFLSEELVADEVARRRFLREARLASLLDHPNICTIYEINEIGGLDFIVMQYAEGETLKQFIGGRPLATATALAIAVQMIDAIRAAHEKGIIHRDIKPGNVIVTKKGQVKILDFGLAKSFARPPGDEQGDVTDLTRQGAQLGTPAYMSPEQARGEAVDHRSDIFSFGVVLYEMVTGRSPFKGKNRTPIDVMHSVVHERPRSASEINSQVSDELRAIIERAMEKEAVRRYQTAAELFDDLVKLKQDSISGIQIAAARKRSWARRPLFVVASRVVERRAAIAAIAALIVAVVATWFYLRSANVAWARRQMPRIEEMARAGNYFDAYNLALDVQSLLPDDGEVARLMPLVSDNFKVTTEPAGAKVYLKRFVAAEPGRSLPRELIGETPINKQIARGEYILYIEKEGFATVERTISSTLIEAGTTLQPPSYGLSRWVREIIPIEEPSIITQKLIEAEKISERMAFVAGGSYRLMSWGKPIDSIVPLGDYLMDKHEVSNREYKEFVNAGGYLKRQYWKHPFVKDGRELSWEEAMREFVDRTGLRGPRSWAGQNFPAGKENHPVTDITWYEAAAFAEFKSKRLPTIFEWEKAARDGIFSHYSALIMPWGPVEVGGSVEQRANFKSGGTTSVDSFEFGMSPYGCYNMAGNVSEWCLNETTEGFITAGGSWDDLSYIFGEVGELPGFHSSNRIGFRCAKSFVGAEGDQGMMRIDTTAQAPPIYDPTSEAAFNGWLTHYQYDRSPLDSQVLEVQETAEWRRERVVYRGAKDERVTAYLYLPKNAAKPFQVIQFVPAADVYGGYITLPESVEMMVAPFIRSGRAVFAVVFRGFKERGWPPDHVGYGPSSVKRRERITNNATDLSRGLDYLETRADVDAARIAYYGFSQGAEEGIMFTAVERRYRSVVLIAGGLPKHCGKYIIEANPANFASHIRAPKLMLNGRYDEAYRFKTEIEPLYKLLRDPKKMVAYESSHCPPLETVVPVVNGWLDETLGPVTSN